ncbi:MAG: P-II family nitrogen regulator [Candidatus Omnitrophota bacterium]
MKLIKAYVRTFIVHNVIEAIKCCGCPRLTAIDVREMGDEIDHADLELSGEYGSTYTTMVKVEIVSTDKCAKKIANIILENARTGYKGDGIVVISPIDDIISIRTGDRGEKVCECKLDHAE